VRRCMGTFLPVKRIFVASEIGLTGELSRAWDILADFCRTQVWLVDALKLICYKNAFAPCT